MLSLLLLAAVVLALLGWAWLCASAPTGDDGEHTHSLPTTRCDTCSEARLVGLVVERARTLLLNPWPPPIVRGQPL